MLFALFFELSLHETIAEGDSNFVLFSLIFVLSLHETIAEGDSNFVLFALIFVLYKAQSITSWPLPTRYSLILEKGFVLKNPPRLADKGDG